MSEVIKSASCLCGAVKFQVGPIQGSAICHCSQCRWIAGESYRHLTLGGPGFAKITEGAEHVKTYQQTPKTQRSFCTKCGTSIYTHAGTEFFAVPVTLLEGQNQPEPEALPEANVLCHVFYPNKSPHVVFRDGAVKFKDMPASYGGSDEKVDDELKADADAKAPAEGETLKGGCSCGKVKLEGKVVKAVAAAYCHCSLCRRANGVPYSTCVVLPEDVVAVTEGKDEMAAYESSTHAKRNFCKDCGSRLFLHVAAHKMSILAPAVFENFAKEIPDPLPESWVPKAHVYYADRLKNFVMKDGLPKLKDSSKAIGGSGVFLDDDGNVTEAPAASA